jgi:hypothetical protein
MADLSFGIAPMDLADALYNAVELSKEIPGTTGCPHVLICYQGDPETGLGIVLVYGVSRIVGGRTTLRLETQGPEDHVSVVIHRDHANEIQSALRGYGRAKSTRVAVRIAEEGFDTVEETEDGDFDVRTVNLSIQKEGQEPLAELADSDPSGEFGKYFDIVDDYLVGSGGPLSGPTAFSFESVKRVTALKGLEARALDLAQTTRKHVIAIAAGPNFRGILGELDREVYAGPDGARADHLLS